MERNAEFLSRLINSYFEPLRLRAHSHYIIICSNYSFSLWDLFSVPYKKKVIKNFNWRQSLASTENECEDKNSTITWDTILLHHDVDFLAQHRQKEVCRTKIEYIGYRSFPELTERLEKWRRLRWSSIKKRNCVKIFNNDFSNPTASLLAHLKSIAHFDRHRVRLSRINYLVSAHHNHFECNST